MKLLLAFLAFITYVPIPNYQPMENKDMAIENTQLRDLIERTLNDFDKGVLSRDAVELLMLTAAVETNLGSYIYQVSGPAKGLFQMEPETFRWLRDKYSPRWPILKYCHPEQLEYNHRIAIIFARLRYLTTPEPLPDHRDYLAMAIYWKKHYNTVKGKGTVNKALAKYHRYARNSKHEES